MVPWVVQTMRLIFAALLADAALHGQNRGQADLALQGFYMSSGPESLSSTTGAAARFQDLIPNVGVLSGGFEGYGVQNQLQTGENFLQLRRPLDGLPLDDHRRGFQRPGSFIDFPFNNFSHPG